MNPLEKGPFKAIVNLIEKRVYTTTVPQKYYDPILTSHSLKVTSYVRKSHLLKKAVHSLKIPGIYCLEYVGREHLVKTVGSITLVSILKLSCET